MLVEDSNVMEPELLSKYKLVVKSKWMKRWILTKLLFWEIVFQFAIIGRAIRSGLFYWGTYKKDRLFKNVRYSEKRERNVMDIYIPSDLSKQPASKPVILYMHGGSWGFGDKIQYILLGKQLSEMGVVLVAMNYTLYPKGLIDEMTDDLDMALKYCFENIEKYHGNPNNIYFMGHSAGAHIGALYCCSTLYKNQKKQAHRFKGCIGLSGPYEISDHFIHEAKRGVEHFSPMRPAMRGPKTFSFYSPSHIMSMEDTIKDGDLPTFYLLHGDADATVPISSSEKLYDILKQRIGSSSSLEHNAYFRTYPKVKHIDLVFNMMDDKNHIILKDVIDIVMEKFQ
eukprot:gene5979-7450_t